MFAHPGPEDPVYARRRHTIISLLNEISVYTGTFYFDMKYAIHALMCTDQRLADEFVNIYANLLEAEKEFDDEDDDYDDARTQTRTWTNPTMMRPESRERTMIKAKDAQYVVLMLETAIDFTTQGYDPGQVLEMLVDNGEDRDHDHSYLRSKYPALRKALIERAQEYAQANPPIDGSEEELEEKEYASEVS